MKKQIMIIFALILVLIIIPNANAFAQTSKKYIIFTFDDNPVGQYIFGKPILDTYGYKGSFMTVCDWVGGYSRMSWNQITSLANDGMDIGSHTMTHSDLNYMSLYQLQNEIIGSKLCLQDHGITPVSFAYPRNHGSENSTVINMVRQYYSIAKSLGSGQQPFWFLSCQGWKSPYNQTDCNTFNKSTGKLQYENQYAVRMRSIDDIEQQLKYNDTLSYNAFVQWVNNQTNYNLNNQIVTIPIVTIHEIVAPTEQSSWLHTNQLVIGHMMKYIHDNNYTVLTLRDLGFNPITGTMYVKGLQTSNQNTHSLLVLNSISWMHCNVPFTITGKLTNTANGNGISNVTIYFTGNGAASLAPVKTKSDGSFSQTGISPNFQILSSKGSSTNGFQVNGIYLGDATITSGVSVQNYGTMKTTGVC